MRRSIITILLVVGMVTTGAVAGLAFGHFGDWSPAVDIEDFGPGAHPDFNTDALEGCPFVSPDGKAFFIASDRAGGEGGLDIWVSTRDYLDDPWGAPTNLGPPINSEHNDFCPTIGRDGRTFFFVSNRPGHCGDTPNADIYTVRFDRNLAVDEVGHLGCDVNSDWDEHSPFPATIPGLGPVLFYSSARPAQPADAPGDHNIYMSTFRGGSYGAGELVPGVNTEFQDGQPNVRRDGLEMFFFSNRPGAAGNDIYSSSRESAFDDWSEPVNLGPNVNSVGAETRPSLSWDGRTLYFGSTRGGSSDIYVTTR
jgi:hypothetical protein